MIVFTTILPNMVYYMYYKAQCVHVCIYNSNPHVLYNQINTQYNEGRSHTEEHTAGTGHMATVPKQASVTASTDFPSTFATQDQLSPLPPSGTHSSTGGTFYEGDYRRGSVSTMVITIMASSPSDAYSQSSSSAVSMKDKQLPLRALETQPPILRFHSNPGPQQSSSREPVRAVAPTPSTTNQNDPCPQQPSTKQPLRVLAPPPSVTNQSVPGFQPLPIRVRQTDGTVPQQQQIVDNLQPWIRYPPKMYSENWQQREIETKQNVKPRPDRSQPQPQQMQQQQSNVQAHSNQQQLGQPHHQMRNVQLHGGYPQGTVQQLQPPQGRPYSDHQQYTAESDAMHQPESHTPHSHPLAGKHSGGMPGRYTLYIIVYNYVGVHQCMYVCMNTCTCMILHVYCNVYSSFSML